MTLKIEGLNGYPYGVAGMGLGPDGKTLVVSMPKARVSYSLEPTGERGDVLVLDLSTLNLKTGAIAAPVKADLPAGNALKAPQTIKATSDKDRFLVSSPNDYNRGLSTLTLTRDAQGKVTTAKLQSIEMNQPGNDVRIDRLNIQRAQSAVLVEKDGVQYAIVADDNYNFLDPYWKAMYEVPDFVRLTPSGPLTPIGGSASAKKVALGGKLGIVKDPFGKLGQPQFMGATLPLDGYGIINLSLSKDGKVLIGQLKGGFSANIFEMQQKAHQSHAWNVEQLIAATLAHPDDKRLQTHITLPNEAEQYITLPTDAAGYTAAPAGTMFNSAPFNVTVEGRMGDVIEVDLKEKVADQVARKLLNLGTTPEADLGGDERRMLREFKAQLVRSGLSDFSLAVGTDWSVYDSAVPANGMRIVGKLEPDQGRNAIKVPVLESRDAQLNRVKFEDEGRFYLVPNITDADEARLRSGQRIAVDKTVQNLNIQFRYKAGDAGWQWGTAIVNATARDIAQVNTFFGDRPLDNPGYSELKLKGEVSVVKAKSGQIDMLDVYKLEQRLKYLGFPAMGTGTGNIIKNFSVDGTFAAEEQAALKLFEKVVRYQNAGPAARYGQALPGADGLIESSNAGQAQITKDWLNAYNAPHWMELFGANANGSGLAANPRIPGWTSSQTGTVASPQVERYGTSWLRDLMVAANSAPAALRSGNAITFNGAVDANHQYTPTGHGSHDLGMALDLGISNYIERLRPNPAWRRTSPATVPRYLPTTSQSNTAEALAVQAVAAANRNWSIANAVTQATQTQLPQTTNYMQMIGNVSVDMRRNLQQSALKDFLSLYSVVRDDATLGVAAAGSRGSLAVGTGLTNAQQAKIRTALFGDGTKAGSLINQVLIGGTIAAGQNPLLNIGRALDNLDITRAASRDHQNHFHIYLKPPVVLAIDTGANALLADSLDAQPLSSASATVNLEDQPVVNNQEMLMFDYFVPPQLSMEPAALIAQATSSKSKILRPFTFCTDIESGVPNSTANAFTVFRNNEYNLELYAKHKVRLIQPPTHGTVTFSPKTPFVVGNTETGIKLYSLEFWPTENYIGKDRAVFEVEANNKKYRVTVNFWVMDTVFDDGQGDTNCKQQKFGLSSDSSQNISAWEKSADLSAFLAAASGVTYSFTDLPGTALGQTTGEGATAAITLDQNAAGYGWYIDATPLDSTDDYLPTSNPNIWQAKPGSEAAGKMDMLSVLLHEYGHALGLDHSADGTDFMAESLQPGQRKLPSAAELQLMAQLVAQLKGEGQGEELGEGGPADPTTPALPAGIALAGLLGARRRPEEEGATPAPSLQKLLAINPALHNADFTQALAGAPASTAGVSANTQGWTTTGSVTTDAVNGNTRITLSEAPNAQTSLMQAFNLGANDRYLSFTVDGLNLNGGNSAGINGPADAFEVALLDPTTYQLGPKRRLIRMFNSKSPCWTPPPTSPCWTATAQVAPMAQVAQVAWAGPTATRRSTSKPPPTAWLSTPPQPSPALSTPTAAPPTAWTCAASTPAARQAGPSCSASTCWASAPPTVPSPCATSAWAAPPGRGRHPHRGGRHPHHLQPPGQ